MRDSEEENKGIIELFELLDAEEKGYLTEKQGDAFWYHMQYLGWPRDARVITRENVISLASECLESHRRITSLLLSASSSEILHRISSSLKEEELEEIIEYIKMT